MRVASILVSLLMTACASAQVRLLIDSGGKRLGTASITQKLNADGSKSVELRMDLPNKLVVRSQNTYDKLGNPIRKFLESIIPGGRLQKQTVATFDARGANLVMLDGSDRKTRQVILVDTAPRANIAEFWLLRDKPTAGQQVKTYVFNMDAQSWDLVTVTYQGTKQIKIAGKTVAAHVVETSGERPSTAYLDDKGLPWRIEAGATTMTRISEN